MTESLHILKITEDDVCKILAAKAHLGEASVNFQMKCYTHPRANASVATTHQIIDIGRMWEKLMLAARAIAAIENPLDVIVVSTRQEGQRAILKFAHFTGATAVAGRFTPGKFTNQQQTGFIEPRLLVACDPFTDHQAITESSFVNLPVIAMTTTNSPLKFVDIAIPCNNKGNDAIGLMWWFLTREVLRLRGSIGRTTEWEVWPDLFIYREPEEEKEEGVVDPSLPKFEDLGSLNKPSADVATQWQDGGTAPVDEWAALGASEDWAATPAKTSDTNWSVTQPTDGLASNATKNPADDWTIPPAQNVPNDWSDMPVENTTTDWSATAVDDWGASTTADGWGAH